MINFGTEKIKGGWGWRVSLSLAAVPAGLLLVGAVFLPETPNSLVQQGKDRREVALLLRRIRGTDDVDRELDGIVAAADSGATAGRSGLRMLLTQRRYRPQLVMAVAIPFFQQVTGINAIAFYAPVLLRTIGMGESASLCPRWSRAWSARPPPSSPCSWSTGSAAARYSSPAARRCSRPSC